MKTVLVAPVALLVVLSAPPAMAGTSSAISERHASVVSQASPSPPPPESPTASPSPGAGQDEGGISTGAGLVIAAVLIGGLLLMRNRLLRR